MDLTDDIVAALNQSSIDGLNGAFGTAFAAGQKLGELDPKTRLVGRRE